MIRNGYHWNYHRNNKQSCVRGGACSLQHQSVRLRLWEFGISDRRHLDNRHCMGNLLSKHFRELRRSSTGATFDCFTVLIKTHVFYFAVYAAAACLSFVLGSLSPNVSNSTSLRTNIYDGALQISLFMQLFVLGPRLILGVREFNAKLVADSDEGTAMTTIAFWEHVPCQRPVVCRRSCRVPCISKSCLNEYLLPGAENR